MTQYRIKAKLIGFWDFIIEADSVEEVKAKARQVFRKTESVRPEIKITSIKKIIHIGLRNADRETRTRVARLGGRAKKSRW